MHTCFAMNHNSLILLMKYLLIRIVKRVEQKKKNNDVPCYLQDIFCNSHIQHNWRAQLIWMDLKQKRRCVVRQRDKWTGEEKTKKRKRKQRNMRLSVGVNRIVVNTHRSSKNYSLRLCINKHVEIIANDSRIVHRVVLLLHGLDASHLDMQQQ